MGPVKNGWSLKKKMGDSVLEKNILLFQHEYVLHNPNIERDWKIFLAAICSEYAFYENYKMVLDRNRIEIIE